jgi:site-specific recombinase XerD
MLLGHGDLETTERYIHLSQEHLHTAANPLAKLKLSDVTESSQGSKRKKQG